MCGKVTEPLEDEAELLIKSAAVSGSLADDWKLEGVGLLAEMLEALFSGASTLVRGIDDNET